MFRPRLTGYRTRAVRVAASAATALALAASVGCSAGDHSASADPASGTGGCAAADSGWALSSTAIDPRDMYHAVVGNGYLGARVPANGTGYTASRDKTGWPLYTARYDGSFVSGLYAHNTKTTSDRQVIAALPTWSGLTVGTGGDTFTSGTAGGRITHYRQTLLLRCGLVRTSLTWTASDGRATDLVYEVFADQADAHVAAVRLRMTPHWRGAATVADRIDGAGARMMAPTGATATHGGTVTVGFRTDGTGTDGAVASTLRYGGGIRPTAQQASVSRSLTASHSVTFPVRSGRAYTLTKYVGVDTALTARSPRSSASTESRRAAAAGWQHLYAAHAAAWRGLWRSGVEVSGQADLQAWIRSSEYGLLSSVRSGSANSIAPAGLTSDNYGGLVFWDAETWMFPSLLAYRPDLARAVVDYRYRTRAAARANARKLGHAGLFYPWESGSSGNLKQECQSWNPPHCITQIHLQSDIALAVWQYYEATGDTGWLRQRGWPVLSGIAQYWSSRVTRHHDGSYSIVDVAGPDEYSNGVTDGVYTNAGAAEALRAATSAARTLGTTAPARWTRIADHLRIPYDSHRHVFEQYQGYHGSLIKQADTVMLLYPLQWPSSKRTDEATLDYYAARTDPDGPAMTDSIHTIDAAAIGEPGCATYTYLRRSIEPFVRGPYDEFSEARGTKAGVADPLAGSPAQDFLTGAGGFLQTFPYGLAGLRWGTDGVRLDPMLPPELADGVTLRGLRWHGRTFDVAIGARHTTVRLQRGSPFTVHTAQGDRTVDRDNPAVLTTRRPDLARTSDLARCQPVSATSAQPGLYADAAVDGNTTTAWVPAGTRGALTVKLWTGHRIDRVSPQWTGGHPARYQVATSIDGRHWQPVPVSATGRLRHSAVATYVRITVWAAGGTHPGLGELTIE